MRAFLARPFGLLVSVGTLAAAGLLVASAVSAQTPSVAIDSATTNVGGHAALRLRALDVPAPGLGAWTVDVSYDPAVLTVKSCTPTGGGVCNTAYSAHTVRTNGISLYGLPGDTTLATIVFTCNAAGESALTVNPSVFADATIGGPRPIDAAVHDGTLTCLAQGQPTPTPRPTDPPLTPVGIKGDVNCDGLVNALDAELILQHTAGIIATLPCVAAADVNHDGLINAVDAALILQHEVGLI